LRVIDNRTSATLNENNIILRCQQGESKAQRLLFDKYYNYVYTTCHRYVQHHHDVEDVVSIVFNRVFKNIYQLTDTAEQGLKRWIQTIAINESLRFIKRQQPIDYTSDDKLLEGATEIKDSPAETDMKLIKKVIDELPTGYRTIFLLNVVEGLSHTEIAEHLGISRNTSKSQMLKARKYLQIKLNSNASRQLG